MQADSAAESSAAAAAIAKDLRFIISSPLVRARVAEHIRNNACERVPAYNPSAAMGPESAELQNQPGELAGYNLFSSHSALVEASDRNSSLRAVRPRVLPALLLRPAHRGRYACRDARPRPADRRLRRAPRAAGAAHPRGRLRHRGLACGAQETAAARALHRARGE